MMDYLQRAKFFRTKKRLGQNFLINSEVIDDILNYAKITKDDIVIEIGPGMGCLTEYLAINAKKVVCYEIDPDMIQVLNENLLPLYNNIEIIGMDFLKADLSIYDKEIDRIKVVANLPYYITTPIIFKLLSETKIKQFLCRGQLVPFH